MLNESERRAVRNSFRLVVPIADTAADLFYRKLFELKPEYRELFQGDIGSQKRKLIRMLAFIVKSLDYNDAEWRDDVPPEQDLMLVVLALGRRHSDLYRIPNESYAVVAEALLWTLDYGLGEAFTQEVRASWTRLYTVLAQTMRLGSAVVDREAALGGAPQADRTGEEALLEHMHDAGIDEARLQAEEPS
jgi:hemoglobin-like flavoprotein